jgi:tRNA A37 methylthiotransferase MiaB
VGRRNRGRIGERVRVLVDGPATDDRLVLKGRLSTQAPEIDASVYLTDCDPSTFQAGGFAEMEVVGARNYDLIARPVCPQPPPPGPQPWPQPPASSL